MSAAVQTTRTAVAASYAAWEAETRKPGTGPGGVKILADVVAEMNLLLFARRHEAELQSLAAGDYLTFDTKSKDIETARIPSGYLYSKSYNIARIEGRKVDVMILVKEDHPMIADILRDLRMFRSARTDEDIQAFNALPLADRKTRIDTHLAAVAAIRELTLRARTAPLDAGQLARLETLMRDTLPAQWVPRTHDYLVHRAQR